MPTGDPREVNRLNNLLGRELGRTPYGDSIFQWEWSDDLFWPAYATGRTVLKSQRMLVPILAPAGEASPGAEMVNVSETVPEYSRDRQTIKRETWFVTKWLKSTDLIHGGTRGHGWDYSPGEEPDHEALERLWKQRFKGADFPYQGWRVPTDAFLPRSPQDPSVPNEPDTLHFITRIKDQTSLASQTRIADMLAQEERLERQKELLIGDEMADMFTAGLNPKPGSRASWVSFPYSRKDRL